MPIPQPNKIVQRNAVQNRIVSRLSRFPEMESRLETTGAIARGGVYGTSSTIAVMRAITQASITGYVAVQDGLQASDLAVLPTLYPEAVEVFKNWSEAGNEVRELDREDIFALVREILDLTESIIEGAAEGATESEVVARSGISPDEAFNAARQALLNTRDLIKLGIGTFKTGFDITKIPALIQMFPQATAIASNAPTAVQGWSMLTLDHQKEFLKLAIEAVFDILKYLKAA